MAASFNRSSWWLKGDVVSTDMRVQYQHGNGGDVTGLTGFGYAVPHSLTCDLDLLSSWGSHTTPGNYNILPFLALWWF